MEAFVEWLESIPVVHLFFSPTIIWRSIPILFKGFQVSVILVVVSYSLAIPLGLLLAFMKMSRSRLFRWPATVYIDVIRGTPLLVQILVIFFGLPLLPGWREFWDAMGAAGDAELLGVGVSQWVRGIMALSLNSAAYMAEIFRAGIQSIHKGQLEAARSLGMTTPKAMTMIGMLRSGW